MLRDHSSNAAIMKAALLGIISACWLMNAAAAQTTTKPNPTSAPKPAEGASSQSDDPLALFRAPLLREGSHLIQVKSRMQRDPVTGGFKLVIDSMDSTAPNYELILLPCTRLSEMSRIIEAAPSQTVAFQVSGEVFVFHGRNYILPTHAPVLTEQETTPNAAVSSASTSAPSASQPAASTTTAPSGDSAQEIAGNLAKAAGPLRHSSAAPARAPSTNNEASTGKSMDDKTAGSSADRDGSGKTSGATARSEKLLREDTNIANRRGKLTRDG